MSSNEQVETKPESESVVWVVNEGGHSYETAAKWGRLMPLTRASINPFALDRLALMIGQRLLHAKDSDYILISGLSILNALVLAMWFTKFDKAQLLQWSTQKQDYVRLVLHASTLIKATREIRPVD